jgi:steroid delta-isomerase-like uncharacterized protein
MTEDLRALLQRYVREIWDAGDPEAVRRFAAAGYRRHVSAVGEPLDLDAQVERLKGMRAAFSDLSLTVEDAVVEGDRIAFRATLRGTHSGAFQGIPPTGRTVTVAVVDIARVTDGRIVEQWGGPDVLDLLRQLGARVEPPG